MSSQFGKMKVFCKFFRSSVLSDVATKEKVFCSHSGNVLGFLKILVILGMTDTGCRIL